MVFKGGKVLSTNTWGYVNSRKEKRITKRILIAFGLLFSYVLISILAGVAHADTTAVNSTTVVNANLLPVISLQMLDSTGTTEITDLDVDILPTPTGAFNKNSAIASVTTTNRTGYALYVTSDYQNHAGTDTTSLIHANTSVDDTTSSSIGNIPALSASGVTETDFSATNSTYKNSWGYSYAWSETLLGDSYSGGSATTYYPVPASSTQTLIRNDVSHQATASNTTITIGANVDTSKAAGTFKNKLVFTAIANASTATFTLNYDANGGSGAPASESVTSMSPTVNFVVSATVPTRAGYNFLGWADSSSAATATYTEGNNVPVTLSGSGTTATKTIYAVWE